MRIALITDAWSPQMNGVVRTLQAITRLLARWGHELLVISPDQYRSIPCPSYPEIRLALVTGRSVGRRIANFAPDAVHIATEGPLGLQAKFYCLEKGLAYTTSYHTRFPQYVSARVPVPTEWSYAYLRWFHSGAAATLVPTPSIVAELAEHHFENLRIWSRGVDTARFFPGPKSHFHDLPGPHLLYVGRVAVEKNVEAFLRLGTEGTKIVVGDGPQLAELRQAFPDAVFLGKKHGDELAALYRSADAFVFPSKTDTFGNVVIEALAAGVPVAAYPVAGPLDILTDPLAGALDDDLDAAVARALTLPRDGARRHAERFTWAAAAEQFRSALVPVAEQQDRAA